MEGGVKALTFGGFYTFMTTAQVFYNKALFQRGFNYPLFCCFAQMVGVLAFCLCKIGWQKYSSTDNTEGSINLDRFWDKLGVMAPVSTCFLLNICLSSLSILYVDLNVSIIVRSTSVFWVMIFGYLMLGFSVTPGKILAVCVVLAGNIIVGFSFAKGRPTSDEFTDEDETLMLFNKIKGLVMVTLSCVANGLMLILMKRLMDPIRGPKSKDGRSIHLQNYDFLFYQTVAGIVGIGVLALFSEGSKLIGWISTYGLTALAPLLSVSAFISVFYQLSLIGLVHNTVPLTKEIISQTKIVPQTFLAISLFSEYYDSSTVVGLSLTVAGCSSYSYLCWLEGKHNVAHAHASSDEEEKETLPLFNHPNAAGQRTGANTSREVQ